MNAPLDRSRLSRLVRLFGSLLVVTGVIGAALGVVALRDKEIDSWRRQMDTMSLMLAEHTSQTMFAAYLVLDSVTERVRQIGATDQATFRARLTTTPVYEMLREKARGLPQIDVVSIVAANGDNINFTRTYPVPPINLADRDYFKAHAENPRLGDFISSPVRNKGNGKWTFYISRRLNDPQGNLMGLVLVGLSVDVFIDYYQRLAGNLGPQATISLFRDDLTLLARTPQADDRIGTINQTGAPHEVLKVLRKKDAVILLDTPRFATDNSALRLAAVRTTEKYPLVVNLIVTEDVFLAGWRRSAWTIAGITAAGALVLLLGIGALARILDRREQTLRELNSSRQVLDSIVENIPTMVFLKHAADLRFALFNRAGEQLLGVGRDRLIGRNDYDFFPKEQADFFTTKDRAVLQQPGVVDIPEEPIETPAGTRILHTRKVALRDEKGEPVFLLGISDDITERKEHVVQLAHAKEAAEAANLAKSKFLATMSHEIRTPMNGILGMAQLLLTPQIKEEERQEYARIILDSGQTLLTILNDILDFSKIEAGRIELERLAFDPAHLLQETATLFAERAGAKGLSVEATWQGAPGTRYLGDPVRLRQMLSNLVSNAIKFTAQGAIRIEGRMVEARAEDVLLEFSVADTGIGIPADKQALLFRPFSQVDASTTREYGGTGLGLSIVSNLARLMGGDIGVDSEAGKGAHFWFRIRATAVGAGEECRQPDRTDAPAEKPAARASAAPAHHVLVVEDNATNRRVVEAMLKRQGISCDSVGNGQKAVDYLTGVTVPDLVLMDVQMPVMDGCEATRRIRAWEQQKGGGHVPIIALTAGAFGEDRERCLAAGMDDFLTKPLDIDRLKATFEIWLSKDR